MTPILTEAERSAEIPVTRSSSAEERLMALADGGHRISGKIYAALGALASAEDLRPDQLRLICDALISARGLASAAIESDVR